MAKRKIEFFVYDHPNREFKYFQGKKKPLLELIKGDPEEVGKDFGNP